MLLTYVKRYNSRDTSALKACSFHHIAKVLSLRVVNDLEDDSLLLKLLETLVYKKETFLLWPLPTVHG